MATYQTDWVDAFTDQPFGGNGCAVVHDAGDILPQTCMKFVRETSLVECTFVEHSNVADFKVRYFLARSEIPFAGHPTIATVLSLLHRGRIATSHITLETQAGLIGIEIDTAFDRPRVIMTQVAPKFGAEMDRGLMAKIGSIPEDSIIATPQIVSTGLPFAIVLLDSLDRLRSVRLNQPLLQKYMQAGAKMNLMEPFWATLSGHSEVGDTFARLLLAQPGPVEDSFTGSATGALGAYLWANNLIEDRNFIAEQGHDMERPGLAQVQVLGPQKGITGVRVAGSGHVLMSGDLFI